LKVREGGRVVGVHALVATGVNNSRHREILGLHVTTSEDGADWLAFFRDLVARGLSGVKLVTSDAHAGDGRRGHAACEEPEKEPAAALDRVAVPAVVRFHFQFVLSDEVEFEPDASCHALAWAGAITLRCDTV
jgi:hypothetical protein